jgi:hypothetical protein
MILKHSSERIWPMARDKEVTSAVHHEFSSHSFDDSALSYLLISWNSLCCAVFTEDTALHAEVGTRNLFFESAIAMPQLAGSTSAIAIPQLFKKCCSATATPQFRNRNFF